MRIFSINLLEEHGFNKHMDRLAVSYSVYGMANNIHLKQIQLKTQQVLHTLFQDEC